MSELITYRADFIFPVSSPPVSPGYVTVDSVGKIISLGQNAPEGTEIITVNGAIIPGFINCHCHLELSHMKGVIPKETHLIPFINMIVKERDKYAHLIPDAIAAADEEMYRNGIVAVGDISNTRDSFEQKLKSKIKYYTFVEFFDLLNPAITDAVTSKYEDVLTEARLKGLPVSATPHAPYSVTEPLLYLLDNINQPGDPISVHNQETTDELLLFQGLKGEFPAFYDSFGIDVSAFDPGTANALEYVLKNMPNTKKILLVHNTMTAEQDVAIASGYNKDIYWCSCPNANLYIEGRLPDYRVLTHSGYPVTLGTDSAASNDQLCIWSEMLTIHDHVAELAFEELLSWATLNGAKFLGLEATIGSIEQGKTPGLIHLTEFNLDTWWKARLSRLV